MRRLLPAAMQYQRTLLRTGSRVQSCARLSAVVSFHGTTPPPAARQLQRGCHRVPSLNEHIHTKPYRRICSTVTRSVSSDQPDSAAAVPADNDSTHAPAASTEPAAAAEDDSAILATDAADIDTTQTSSSNATSSSSSSEPVQLPGSLHTVWAAFLQHLWDRGYFADSSTTEKDEALASRRDVKKALQQLGRARTDILLLLPKPLLAKLASVELPLPPTGQLDRKVAAGLKRLQKGLAAAGSSSSTIAAAAAAAAASDDDEDADPEEQEEQQQQEAEPEEVPVALGRASTQDVLRLLWSVADDQENDIESGDVLHTVCGLLQQVLLLEQQPPRPEVLAAAAAAADTPDADQLQSNYSHDLNSSSRDRDSRKVRERHSGQAPAIAYDPTREFEKDHKRRLLRASPYRQVREGDWFCGQCGAHNFRSNSSCVRCSVPESSSLGSSTVSMIETRQLQQLGLGQVEYESRPAAARFVFAVLDALAEQPGMSIVEAAKAAGLEKFNPRDATWAGGDRDGDRGDRRFSGRDGSRDRDGNRGDRRYGGRDGGRDWDRDRPQRQGDGDRGGRWDRDGGQNRDRGGRWDRDGGRDRSEGGGYRERSQRSDDRSSSRRGGARAGGDRGDYNPDRRNDGFEDDNDYDAVAAFAAAGMDDVVFDDSSSVDALPAAQDSEAAGGAGEDRLRRGSRQRLFDDGSAGAAAAAAADAADAADGADTTAAWEDRRGSSQRFDDRGGEQRQQQRWGEDSPRRTSFRDRGGSEERPQRWGGGDRRGGSSSRYGDRDGEQQQRWGGGERRSSRRYDGDEDGGGGAAAAEDLSGWAGEFGEEYAGSSSSSSKSVEGVADGAAAAGGDSMERGEGSSWRGRGSRGGRGGRGGGGRWGERDSRDDRGGRGSWGDRDRREERGEGRSWGGDRDRRDDRSGRDDRGEGRSWGDREGRADRGGRGSWGGDRDRRDDRGEGRSWGGRGGGSRGGGRGRFGGGGRGGRDGMRGERRDRGDDAGGGRGGDEGRADGREQKGSWTAIFEQ